MPVPYPAVTRHQDNRRALTSLMAPEPWHPLLGERLSSSGERQVGKV